MKRFFSWLWNELRKLPASAVWLITMLAASVGYLFFKLRDQKVVHEVREQKSSAEVEYSEEKVRIVEDREAKIEKVEAAYTKKYEELDKKEEEIRTIAVEDPDELTRRVNDYLNRKKDSN